jgi:hypothetical protein
MPPLRKAAVTFRGTTADMKLARIASNLLFCYFQTAFIDVMGCTCLNAEIALGKVPQSIGHHYSFHFFCDDRADFHLRQSSSFLRKPHDRRDSLAVLVLWESRWGTGDRMRFRSAAHFFACFWVPRSSPNSLSMGLDGHVPSAGSGRLNNIAREKTDSR